MTRKVLETTYGHQYKESNGMPDSIPNWVLRDFGGYISGPIADVFNPFRKGFIPSIWKCTDVVSFPKVNPPKCLGKDLRPISITPTISKVQERCVYAL